MASSVSWSSRSPTMPAGISIVLARIDTRYCSTNRTLSSGVTATMITAPPSLLRSTYSHRPRRRMDNQRPWNSVSTGARTSSGARGWSIVMPFSWNVLLAPMMDVSRDDQITQACPRQWTEPQLLAQGLDAGEVPGLAAQGFGMACDRDIERDAGKAPVEPGKFGMFLQPCGTGRCPAQAQVRYFVDTVEQAVQVAEMGEQGGGCLRAD